MGPFTFLKSRRVYHHLLFHHLRTSSCLRHNLQCPPLPSRALLWLTASSKQSPWMTTRANTSCSSSTPLTLRLCAPLKSLLLETALMSSVLSTARWWHALLTVISVILPG